MRQVAISLMLATLLFPAAVTKLAEPGPAEAVTAKILWRYN